MTGLKLHPKTGAPLKTLENVRTVLDEWPAIRGRIELDTFHNQIITRARLPWQYEPGKKYKFPHEWTDADRAELNLAVEKILGFNAPNLIDTAFTACAAQNTYHPIKNYLNGLEWRRIRHPGVKFDNMVILTGPQGGYKSTILHTMGGKWFSDSIRTFDGKDAMEALRGVWLMEISELEAMRRSEVTAVKAFLSKTADRYRAAYGRYVNEYPRQCVMFGTTNSNAFLSDITGGRRFWPLRTDEQLRLKDVPKDLPLERDQIWAEAVYHDQLGEAVYLDTYELQQEAKREQEEYREADPWEATIKEFVERPVPVDWDEWPIQRRNIYWAGVAQGDLPPATERRRVCAAEVWVEALGKRPEDMTQTEARRINAILSSLPGWEKKGKMPPEHPYGRQRAFVHNISD